MSIGALGKVLGAGGVKASTVEKVSSVARSDRLQGTEDGPQELEALAAALDAGSPGAQEGEGAPRWNFCLTLGPP